MGESYEVPQAVAVAASCGRGALVRIAANDLKAQLQRQDEDGDRARNGVVNAIADLIDDLQTARDQRTALAEWLKTLGQSFQAITQKTAALQAQFAEAVSDD